MQKDPDFLARLAAEGAPEVVRELLRNPQLTEPFAVRIAARRPCRPETLRLLAESRALADPAGGGDGRRPEPLRRAGGGAEAARRSWAGRTWPTWRGTARSTRWCGRWRRGWRRARER